MALIPSGGGFAQDYQQRMLQQGMKAHRPWRPKPGSSGSSGRLSTGLSAFRPRLTAHRALKQSAVQPVTAASWNKRLAAAERQ